MHSSGALVRAGDGSHLARMHAPILVRELSEQERAQLESALRAASAFTMRRAQTVLASAAGRARSRETCAVPCGRCATPPAPPTPPAWRAWRPPLIAAEERRPGAGRG